LQAIYEIAPGTARIFGKEGAYFDSGLATHNEPPAIAVVDDYLLRTVQLFQHDSSRLADWSKTWWPMLADLDELILRYRDERAKSCIVAVCYDIIDKLRELALAGDEGAEQVLQTLDAARRANDLPKTLKLERELIDLARDRHPAFIVTSFELPTHGHIFRKHA
jgi:hypothetical protein